MVYSCVLILTYDILKHLTSFWLVIEIKFILMNELILFIVSFIFLFLIPAALSRLKYPLQSYIKITSALLLLIFAWVFESSDNQIWPRLMLSAISLSVITREIKTLASYKRNCDLN